MVQRIQRANTLRRRFAGFLFLAEPSLSYLLTTNSTDAGWNSMYRELEKECLSKRRQYRPNLLEALRKKYSGWSKEVNDLPPFPFFIELPSIRQLLKSVEGFNKDFKRQWDQDELVVKRSEIEAALRWIKLSHGRLIVNGLARISKTTLPIRRSSLFSENTLLPPAHYEGVYASSSTSGLLLNDPATISDQQIDELLNRFSHQAWYFNNQPPQSFLSVRSSKLNRINSLDYKGPLFPQFHTFWHQILIQILEKTGVKDGDFDSTMKTLRNLGPCFSCGACSSKKKKEEAERTKMDLTKLVCYTSLLSQHSDRAQSCFFSLSAQTPQRTPLLSRRYTGQSTHCLRSSRCRRRRTFRTFFFARQRLRTRTRYTCKLSR